jgi:acyl carrier protein
LVLKWPNQAALRTLLTGGDTLHNYPPPELPFQVVNNYGPTECTVVATSEVLHPYDQPDRRPTIGRAIDQTQVHILDEQRREVPVGSVGEIYIGGVGVARGYRNEPELTAARFVPSPFQPGARLYKTGDLARCLADGRIAFIGRSDDQIKIRGFRIEPNEIVAALNDVPGVAASAVVASEVGGGDKRLVAYVVLGADAQPTKSGLQEALQSRLPEYMVPAVFVRVDALPVGLHGKIDRGALPEPNPVNTLRDGAFQEPRSQVEETVAGLVQGLLGVERVSVEDNFFLLGGHSLLGTQLIARICSTFGVELGLRSVFEAPTVAQLSTKIEQLLIAKLDTMSEEEARLQLERHAQAVSS